VQKERHHGKQENEENSRKETRREASFVGDYFIEERLAAGPVWQLALTKICKTRARVGNCRKEKR
jgi:hypothetical protein